MTCPELFTGKYAGRPSPNRPANAPGCQGKLAIGNDGSWYESRPDKRGIYTWKKLGGVPSPSNSRIVRNIRTSSPAVNRPRQTVVAQPQPRRRTPTPQPRRRTPTPKNNNVINLTGNNTPRPRPRSRSRSLPRAASLPPPPPNAPWKWEPMLAGTLKQIGNLRFGAANMYASEKFDGIRMAWDGKGHLWTRGGQKIKPPAAFLAALPRGVALDGELYAGRGKFSLAQSMYSGPSNYWLGAVQYRVFDMPAHPGNYKQVYETLRQVLPGCTGSNLSLPVCVAPQRVVKSHDEIKRLFEEVLAGGGEGLMIRRGNKAYQAGKRSPHLLKLKKKGDAEAEVIGYTAGSGQNSGVIGALQCRWVTQPSVTFKVGTGFSSQQRSAARTLFPIGTRITVEFMELNPSGRPRFPVFKSVRTNL